MENWYKRTILLGAGICWLGLTIPAAFAQEDDTQVIAPDLDRREIQYEAIDTENFEIGAFYGVISIEDFTSSEVAGLRLAYHISEDFFFEASYGVAEGDLTSFEKLSGGSPLFTEEDREYSYYDVSLGWNFLPGEAFIWDAWAFNTQLYVIGGVGSTEFAGEKWFTVNLGAGVRVLLNDLFAWHLDFRDHVFDRDTFGEDQTTNNLEIHTGITLFF